VTLPLDGLLVVDLSRAIAGPHAAMMLGDMGARVIKVESPGAGDDSRTWGPFVGPTGTSSYFMAANRNKESVVADLKTPEGTDLLGRLLRRADVLVENFRPGVLDRLGFPPAELAALNPRLVVLSITGFGMSGPDGQRPGYDQILQGEAGLMSLTGPSPEEPTRLGIPICDVSAGVHGAFGVVTALLERERTGVGGVVRTSLLAAAVGIHTFQGTAWTVAGQVPTATGRHHPSIAPYGAFRCGDALIQVAVGSQRLWSSFAAVVGLDPDQPAYRTNQDRVANRDRLVADIELRLTERDLDAWVTRLAAAGVPVGRVRRLDQVYDWEQTRSQGLVIQVDHAELGVVELPGPPVQLSSTAGRTHAAPPTLGQHTESVAAWLDNADRRATSLRGA
jgi:crotonobetainyl-CoA:carnitine CoA-transferase CaiB-like acyl-CoA transferase